MASENLYVDNASEASSAPQALSAPSTPGEPSAPAPIAPAPSVPAPSAPEVSGAETTGDSGGNTATPPPAMAIAEVAGIQSGKSKVSLNAVNLILIGLVAAGILSVYMLSLFSGPAEASAEMQSNEARVDAALSKMSAGVNDKDPIAMIDTFYYEARQRQIPLGQLHGNPFVFEASMGLNSTSPMDHGPIKGSARIQKQQAMGAVQSLVLQTVLKAEGDRTKAIISNNLVSEGQNINGWTVKSIQSKQVVLKWKDLEFVLKMAR